MKDKYNMTKEENIFLAKRNIIDSIWKSANLEGVAITFPDTQTILEGSAISGYTIDEQNVILNLKDAWYFILDNIDYPIDWQFYSKINKEIGERKLIINAGNIRKSPVKIGGTSWMPDILDLDETKKKIDEILKQNKSITETSLDLMLYTLRNQTFLDGNKITSMLLANKLLIENGKGILSIPNELKNEFAKLLIEFYETNNSDKIKLFLYEKCIDGLIL